MDAAVPQLGRRKGELDSNLVNRGLSIDRDSFFRNEALVTNPPPRK